MTTELSAEFGSLDERARHHARSPFADRISLRDHVVEVEIGAFETERGHSQRLRFELVVEVSTHAQGDDVDGILSYDSLTEAVDAELAAGRLNLLETLAENIAARVLRAPLAERVFVRIEKLDRGTYDLGVEIVRDQSAVSGAKAETAPIRPTIIVLRAGAEHAPHFSDWVSQLDARPGAALFLLSPNLPARSADPHAQRRIDLLSLEQAAWEVAGRDARLVVMSSKTELTHAIAHQSLALWAPSKLVLDTLDPPAPAASESAALAGWLAEQLGGAEILELGKDHGATL